MPFYKKIKDINDEEDKKESFVAAAPAAENVMNYNSLFAENKLPPLQDQTNEILLKETSRLKSKKANMDADYHNQDRMILLNQSYLEKQKMYSVIILLFVFFFGFAVFLGIFKERLGYTQSIVTSIQVLSLAIGAVSILFVGKSIAQRDNIEFSKLDQKLLMKTYKTVDSSYNELTEYTAAAESGDLSKTFQSRQVCVGAECCGPGFRWDTSMCVTP